MEQSSSSNDISKNFPKNKLKNFYATIKDFSHLSIIEIITLEFLFHHKEPVVRHTLYTEVKNFLELKDEIVFEKDLEVTQIELSYIQFLREDKKISTSTFYNNLKNLEKRGLLSYVKDEKGKVISIEQNNRTGVVLEIIRNYFFRMDIINYFNYQTYFEGANKLEKKIGMTQYEEGANKLVKKIGKTQYENVLFIWFYERCDFQLFKLISSLAKSVFIVCKERLFEEVVKSEFEDFIFTRVSNQLIREPNDFFDLSVFIYKDVGGSFVGVERFDLLKEVVRVTKKGGNVILSNFSELHHTENDILNQLVDIFTIANRDQISKASELEEDMTKAGLTKHEVFDHKGLIFGLGWVE